MPRKPIKQKKRIEPIQDWLIKYLETGVTLKGDEDGALDCFLLSGRPDEIRKVWEKHRRRILANWIKTHPGTRPWPWWDFDAPEPRKRLGGIGTVAWEVLNYRPSYHLGIPNKWVDDFAEAYYNGRARDIHGKIIECKYKEGNFSGKAINWNDPPTYESQTAYLKHHNLILKTEQNRLKPSDFEPEVIKT
jgi:hypothetical protein